jgi:hypothetical protein
MTRQRFYCKTHSLYESFRFRSEKPGGFIGISGYTMAELAGFVARTLVITNKNEVLQ